MNIPPSLSQLAHAGREVTITYLTPERFAAAPQVGLTITQEWHSLLRWLTWPTVGETKQACGAWCPSVLEGGAVKGGRGPMSLLTFDVDDCSEGALDRSAAVLAPHAGAVIPTFSATPEKPKHRIVLLPSRPLTADEFTVAWPQMVGVLATCGIVVVLDGREHRVACGACRAITTIRATLGGGR